MGLLAPVALSLAALAAPIIALYLLKIRRREQVVSSTLLWDRLARDLEANAPWQRFRPNWLLFLQLLALAALVLALTRPFLRVDAALAESVVLVVDISASMGATDIEGGRIGAAKNLADELIGGLPGGGQMLLIAAGAQARVIQPMTDDRQALSDALDELQAEKGGAAIDDALMLAVAAAGRLPRSEIVLISDGGVDPTILNDLAVPARTLFIEPNVPENLGITTMAVRRNGSGMAELFLRIFNAGTTSRAARVTITDADSKIVVTAADLTIESRSDESLTFSDIPSETAVLQATLSPIGRDDLAADDTAWARVRAGDHARVLLVTPGNLFLERGLGLLPDLEVSLAPSGTVPSGYDLYIFDGVAPPIDLGAPTLLFNPPPDNGVIEANGVIDNPTINGIANDDPLLLGVALGQIHIAQAAALSSPTWATSLVNTPEGSLLFYGTRDGAKTAVVAFDLHDSDLPLQTAFPVLLANLVGWLLPETGVAPPESVAPGAVVALHPRAGADRVEITTPSGATRVVPAASEVLFAGTADLGAYAVRDMAGESLLRSSGFTVNLLDTVESSLAPVATATAGGSAQSTTGPAIFESANAARRFIWWPVVVLALLILGIEWWAYYRGRRWPRTAWPTWLRRSILKPRHWSLRR